MGHYLGLEKPSKNTSYSDSSEECELEQKETEMLQFILLNSSPSENSDDDGMVEHVGDMIVDEEFELEDE